MTRQSIAPSIVFFAFLLIAVSTGGPMRRVAGEEPGKKPEPAAGKDTGRPPAVKLDIEETICDEKKKVRPSKYDYCLWLFTKKFKQFGFRVMTAGKEREGEGKGKEGKGAGEREKKLESAPDIAPDLIITVKIRVKVWYSEYWGQKIAWPGVSSATALISSPTGKVLAEIKDADKKGGKGRQDAIVKNLKRISPFLLSRILKAEPVYSRIPSPHRSHADAYIARVEKIRGKKQRKK